MGPYADVDVPGLPSGDRELQEVPAEVGRQIRLRRVIVENATKLLASAEDRAASMQRPARVGRGQVEQLERAVEGVLEPVAR